MWVKFVTGTRAGQTAQLEGDQLATALQLGLAVETQAPVQKVLPQAVWSIGKHFFTGRPFIQLECPQCSRKDRYSGLSVDAKTTFARHACMHAGPLPQAVATAYAVAFYGDKIIPDFKPRYSGEYYHAMTTSPGAKPQDAYIGYYDERGQWIRTDGGHFAPTTDTSHDDAALAAAMGPSNDPAPVHGLPKPVPQSVIDETMARIS